MSIFRVPLSIVVLLAGGCAAGGTAGEPELASEESVVGLAGQVFGIASVHDDLSVTTQMMFAPE